MGGVWGVRLFLAFLLHLLSFNSFAAALPSLNVSFADRIHYDPSTLNSTGVKGLNSSGVNCEALRPPPSPELWSQIHWDCRIPPFHDFRNESSDLDGLSDREIFHFTPENIARSNVHTWYMAWSRERLNDPTWNATEWPEVHLFALDFLPSWDFKCYISMTHCMHLPSASEIREQWPGRENKSLAQRIYLQIHMLETVHQEKLQQKEALTVAGIHLTSKAYSIVKTFTKQANSGAVTGCQVIHKAVDLAIQIGLSMANGAASAVSNALTAKGSLFEVLASVNVLDGKRFSNMGFGMETFTKESGETFQKLVQKMRDDWSDAAKFDWFGTLQQQFWSGTDELVKKAFNQKVPSKVGNTTSGGGSLPAREHLDPGMAADVMCSEFEGDFQDKNEANTHSLEEAIGDWFSKIREEVLSAYNKMYHGWIARPGIGMPSQMAIHFAMRDWPPLNGPNSTADPLKDAAKYEANVKRQTLKQVLGMAMGDDGIYLYCMHKPDASEQCNVDTNEKGKHYPGWWKDYRDTQICPRPKEDPTLLCSAARWYHASTMGSHVSSMPGVRLIENFSRNDFHLTVKELLQEAYETYVLYRNNATAIDWTNQKMDGPVFALPTCVNDNLVLHDGNPLHKPYHSRNVSHHQFPSICGDWRGNETAGFLDALNLGPDSPIYKAVDGVWGSSHPNELFWDRIPRVLAEKYLTPVSHYLALCGTGVRLPVEKDGNPKEWHDSIAINRFRPTNKRDEDCDLIQHAVRNMTETQANEWFCDFDGRSHHTVHQRQILSYMLPHTLWIMPAHKKKCHNWIKREGKWDEFKEINRLIDHQEKEEKEQKKDEEKYFKAVTNQEEKDQIAEDRALAKLMKAAIKEEAKHRKEDDQAAEKMEKEIIKARKEEEKMIAKLLKEMEDDEKKQRKEEAAALKSLEADAEKAHREDEKRRKKEANKDGN